MSNPTGNPTTTITTTTVTENPRVGKIASRLIKLSVLVLLIAILWPKTESAQNEIGTWFEKGSVSINHPQADCADAKNKYYPPGYNGLVEIEMRPECWSGYNALPIDWPTYTFQPIESSGYFIWFNGKNSPIYVPPPPANPASLGEVGLQYIFCSSANGGITAKPTWSKHRISFPEAETSLGSDSCYLPMTTSIFRVSGKGKIIFRCTRCPEKRTDEPMGETDENQNPQTDLEQDETTEEEQIPPDDKN